MYHTNKYLANLYQYHNKLARDVDDADWIGDTEKSSFLQTELDHVKQLLDKGETYYPLF